MSLADLHFLLSKSRSGLTLPRRRSWVAALLSGATLLLVLEGRAQNAYLQHNLVSDLPGQADRTDTNLVNPWGIATSGTSPFWLADNHSGLSTLYNSTGGVLTLVVTVPPAAGGQPPGSPTGIVFNGNSKSFLLATNQPARFIFATEDGTVSGWNAGSNAVIKADNSAAGTVYKGLALATSGGSNFLYATDFHHGKIDVFDSSFNPVTLPGGFSDTSLPARFAPFGIQALNGKLYVTYAMQDAAQHDDVSGAGNGFVNVFDLTGKMLQRLASQNVLNSPWGMAMAPAGFGQWSGALLVGNFGDGRINAFDPATGAALGTLAGTNGSPISITGLWGIKFGNGGQGGDPFKLYFAAGIPGPGSLEDHGLFGSLEVASSVSITSSQASGSSLNLQWSGGDVPYLVQRKAGLSDTNWFDVLTTTNLTAAVPNDGTAGVYRIMDHAPREVMPFTIWMSSAAEVPVVQGNATGFGLLSLKGTNLSYQVEFSGLSGPAVAAHIHGPADTTLSTNVITPLQAPAATSGILSGTVDVSGYTSNQLVALKSGRTYINIHTAANPGGEVRGQIAPVNYSAVLTGAGEVPPTTSQGAGQANLMLIGDQLTWTVTYSGLSSSAVAAHVHGPASSTAAAPVLFGIGTPAGTSGTLTGTHTLSASELDDLLNGQTYINIHTTTNPGGEIRGQLAPD